MSITEEQRIRYQATRRRKYQDDPKLRARILAEQRAKRAANRETVNARRRQRWATDPQFREKNLASRRWRCQRDSQLKTLYGISVAEYLLILDRQGGVCAICGQPPEDRLCVDHCHHSSAIRGLLCRKCNTGLGCYRDDPDLMLKAINYLRSHNVDQ